MAEWRRPDRGVAFWPVGNGDSLTVFIDEDTVIQIDVSHRQLAEDDDDPRVPVVDRLADELPRAPDGKTPRLTVLAITHHDEDHCSGFGRLCKEFQVDEMWLTLRSFIEDKNGEGLHVEGQAIYDEAKRRRDAEIKARNDGNTRAAEGDRLRIIGRHELLEDPDWVGFPPDLVTRAGQYVPDINGADRTDIVEVFVHTPFHEDTGEGSRNSSSLGLQLTLKDGDCAKRFLLLGDLEYKQIEAFFDKSIARGNADRLWWDFLLAPHHCSRNAITRKDGDDWVEADAFDDLKRYAADGARIIVSSRPFGCQSDDDTDPPHDEARAGYEKIVGKTSILCTADVAEGSDSEPVTVEVTEASCGECREPKAAWKARIKSMQVPTGAALRPGDTTTGSGRKEFA